MRFWKPRKIEGNPRLAMIVASYINGDVRRGHALHCLLCSFLAQTYKNWIATVVHDGSVSAPFYLPTQLFDNRVKMIQTKERLQQFGHPHRRKFALEAQADYIGFTNDDNYYMPTYFEWMLGELVAKKADFVYCDMVHSHRGWKPMTTTPRYRGLDMGGFIASKALIEKTPWTDYSFRGDGMYINALTANARKVIKVPATLFVHN